MKSEILVVNVEIPWTRLESWTEEQVKHLREHYIRKCIDCASKITLTGVMTDIGEEGWEGKDIRIKV